MRRLFVLVLTITLTAGFNCCIASASSIHTVTFDENLSVGTSLLEFQSASSSAPLTSFSNLQPSFQNGSLGFFGWNTKPNGTGQSWSNSQSYSFATNLVLYAQWKSPFHSVTFFSNTLTSPLKTYVQTEMGLTSLTDVALMTSQFLNPGFQFIGWNTKANGLGTNYKNDAVYSFASDLTLYAQWKKAPSQSHALRLIGVVTTGNEGPQVRSISRVISHEHLKSLDIVQCGTSAPNGKALASSLAQKMVEGNGGAVSIGYRLSPQSPVAETEVFALVTVPSPTV